MVFPAENGPKSLVERFPGKVVLAQQLGEGFYHREDDIAAYRQALAQGEVVLVNACSDSRVWGFVYHPKAGGVWVDLVKRIAAAVDEKESFQKGVSNYGMVEMISHHHNESICGGEEAKFNFYSLNADLFETEGMRIFSWEVELERRVGKFWRNLINHEIPPQTAQWVARDLLWARSETAARDYWRRKGVEPVLVDRIVTSLGYFRDVRRLGLEAALKAVVMSDWAFEVGWDRVVTAAVADHTTQISRPVAAIGVNEKGEREFRFADDLVWDNFIEAWPQYEPQYLEAQDFGQLRHAEMVVRYYRQATQEFAVDGDMTRQGDVYLLIDDLFLVHPKVVVGKEVMKPGESFGVSVYGSKLALSSSDKQGMDMLGYGLHLGDRGILLFTHSQKRAELLLSYIEQTWGREVLAERGGLIAVVAKDMSKMQVYLTDAADSSRWTLVV